MSSILNGENFFWAQLKNLDKLSLRRTLVRLILDASLKAKLKRQ